MTDPHATSAGIDAALAVLAKAELSGCGATAAGLAGEVLLLSVPESLEEAVIGAEGAHLRARLRDTGFRYVALDLAPRSGNP